MATRGGTGPLKVAKLPLKVSKVSILRVWTPSGDVDIFRREERRTTMALTMQGSGSQARVPTTPQAAGGRIPTDPVQAGLGANGRLSPDPTTAAAQAAGVTMLPT